MVEHAEVKDNVELAECVEVHRHEVVDDRLHFAVEVLVGHVEALLARKDVVEQEVAVDLVGIGKEALGFALVVVGLPGGPVQSPHVVIECHHPGRACGLRLVGVLPVPGPDIEDGLAMDVGQGPGIREQVVGVRIPLGDQTVAEIHRVEPLMLSDALD